MTELVVRTQRRNHAVDAPLPRGVIYLDLAVARPVVDDRSWNSAFIEIFNAIKLESKVDQ